MVRLLGYVDRDAQIIERCRGRGVLHLGCVGFTDCTVDEKVAKANDSLHQLLTEASDCLGVDLDRESVAQLRQRGVFRNVICGDVERLEDLPFRGEQFDVVVAGDIIEHLSNPGQMLDGIRPLLKADGFLIVSTPNAMGLPAYLRYAAGRFREGLQHVLCFNPSTLTQLLERHGYYVTEAFACHQRGAVTTHRSMFRVGKLMFEQCPKFGGTLLFVAGLAPLRK